MGLEDTLTAFLQTGSLPLLYPALSSATISQLTRILGPDLSPAHSSPPSTLGARNLPADLRLTRSLGILLAWIDGIEGTVGRQESVLLTQYICGILGAVLRLENEEQRLESTKTLMKMVEGLIIKGKCGVGEVVAIWEALTGSLPTPLTSSLPAFARYSILSLIDTLMGVQRSVLKDVEPPFLPTYAAFVTGEKDPRNLLLAFAIARVIGLEWDLSDHKRVEDLFDITFCYFPITFTPPKDDPYGISPTELQVALRACLSSTPRFASLALPLFLDKVQGGSERARRQTMEALKECLPVYGVDSILLVADPLWETLSVEIFHATDAALETLAQETLQALLASIYVTSETVRDDLAGPEKHKKVDGVAVRICDTCLQELEEPDKTKAKQATSVLGILLSTDVQLASYVINRAVPQLLRQYRTTSKPANLRVLVSLLSSLRSLPQASVLDSLVDALAIFKDEVLALFVTTSSHLSDAIRGIAEVLLLEARIGSEVATFVPVADYAYGIDALGEILLEKGMEVDNTPEEWEHVHQALAALVDLSKHIPKVIEERIVFRLYAMLPATSSDLITSSYRYALSYLSRLCATPELSENFVLRLLSRFEGFRGAECDRDVIYGHHLLSALLAILNHNSKLGDLGRLSTSGRRIVERLIRCFAPFQKSSEREIKSHSLVLVDSGKIVTFLARNLGLRDQKELLRECESVFFDKPPPDFLSEFGGSLPLHPFEETTPLRCMDTIILYSSLLVAIMPQAIDRKPDLEIIMHRSVNTTNEIEYQALMDIVSTIVNKHAQEDTAIAETIRMYLPQFWETNIIETSIPISRRLRAVEIWTVVARSLIFRGHSTGFDFALRLLDLFQDEYVAEKAAKSFGDMLDDHRAVLSRVNFADVKLLYAQRFCSLVIPKLEEGYRSTSRSYYLVALCSILPKIPPRQRLTTIPPLLPLLLSALELHQTSLQMNVLSTIVDITRESALTLEPHARTLVESALNVVLTSGLQLGSRVEALRLLAVMPTSMRYEVFHTLRPVVLRQLGEVLDDRNKQLRKSAVECRGAWFRFSA